jgi:serine/threonine-protein kinase
MTPQQAEAALQQVGLVLGQQRPQETADPSQVNNVINSNPRAGETAKGGAQVDIVVGAQQTGVRVPDVSGQDVDDAVNALEDAGLTAQRPDGADDTDKVSGTNPPANQTVPRGTEIQLLTGGDGEVTMPDLTGLREEQAKDRLGGLGFQRVSIRREQSNESQDGRVIDQSVDPGRQVSTDQTLTLTIGDAPGGLVN